MKTKITTDFPYVMLGGVFVDDKLSVKFEIQGTDCSIENKILVTEKTIDLLKQRLASWKSSLEHQPTYYESNPHKVLD